MNVAVLGASDDPSKYSNTAVKFLLEKGHRVFPVHPEIKKVEGLDVFPSLSSIREPVDTLTLYVSPRVSSALASEILRSSPKRIIFNPGAENPELEAAAEKRGIRALEACTLVLLRTNQFENK